MGSDEEVAGEAFPTRDAQISVSTQGQEVLVLLRAVLVGDRLFVTNSRGEAVLIALADGKVTDHIKLPGAVEVPAAVASGTIYLLTDGADLVALR